MRSSSVAISSVRSSLGKRAWRRADETRSAGFWSTAHRVRPCADRTLGSTRACARPSGVDSDRPPSRGRRGEVGGVAAQEPVVDLARRGCDPRPSAPTRRRRPRRRGACFSAMPRVARLSSKRMSAVPPGAWELDIYDCLVVPHQCRHWTGRDIRPADRGRRGRRTASYPVFHGIPYRAQVMLQRRSTRSCENGSEGRDRDAWIGMLCLRHGDRQASLEQRGLGGSHSRRDQGSRLSSQLAGTHAANCDCQLRTAATGCRRGVGPAPGRTARSTSGIAIRMQPCEAALPSEPTSRGAVDAGAVEDPEPARLERVVGRAAGDHLAGEVAGPVAVRHVPGRVHRLVLDVVEPGRRLEPDLPDGDLVGLREPQVLEVAAAGRSRGPP